jgi:hypothetical protein
MNATTYFTSNVVVTLTAKCLTSGFVIFKTYLNLTIDSMFIRLKSKDAKCS